MKRYAMLIGITSEKIAEYKALHAAIWPAVAAQIRRSNIRNYSIYLREPENLLFGYFEYHGECFEKDMSEMASDAETQRWWAICGPCQVPLDSRNQGEHWALMEEVFHLD